MNVLTRIRNARCWGQCRDFFHAPFSRCVRKIKRSSYNNLDIADANAGDDKLCFNEIPVPTFDTVENSDSNYNNNNNNNDIDSVAEDSSSLHNVNYRNDDGNNNDDGDNSPCSNIADTDNNISRGNDSSSAVNSSSSDGNINNDTDDDDSDDNVPDNSNEGPFDECNIIDDTRRVMSDPSTSEVEIIPRSPIVRGPEEMNRSVTLERNTVENDETDNISINIVTADSPSEGDEGDETISLSAIEPEENDRVITPESNAVEYDGIDNSSGDMPGPSSEGDEIVQSIVGLEENGRIVTSENNAVECDDIDNIISVTANPSIEGDDIVSLSTVGLEENDITSNNATTSTTTATTMSNSNPGISRSGSRAHENDTTAATQVLAQLMLN